MHFREFNLRLLLISSYIQFHLTQMIWAILNWKSEKRCHETTLCLNFSKEKGKTNIVAKNPPQINHCKPLISICHRKYIFGTCRASKEVVFITNGLSSFLPYTCGAFFVFVVAILPSRWWQGNFECNLSFFQAWNYEYKRAHVPQPYAHKQTFLRLALYYR